MHRLYLYKCPGHINFIRGLPCMDGYQVSAVVKAMFQGPLHHMCVIKILVRVSQGPIRRPSSTRSGG